MREKWGIVAAGACAGALNGLFGAGGGMILVPMLVKLSDLSEDQVFPASVSIILPICLISLLCTPGPLPWVEALPYLIGGGMGGLGAGLMGHKIPSQWLHRGLGVLILWGGYRWLLG